MTGVAWRRYARAGLGSPPRLIIMLLWRARVKNAHDGLATAPQRFGTARVPCPRLLAAALPMLVVALGPS